MKNLFSGGFLAGCRRVYHLVNGFLEKTRINKIALYAAHASYFMVLAVFPMLLLVLGVLRYTPLELMDLLLMLEGLVPAALLPAVERLVISTFESTSTAVVSVSAIAALWSASRSIYGLMLGLNAICDVKESRGYLYTRSISVVYMFLFLLVLLLTLLLHVFGQTILNLILFPDYPIFHFIRDLINSRFVLLLLVQTGLFTAMYVALPNRRNRAMECLPGAVFASLGWQGFSLVFSLYIENFNQYSNIYGSVYAVALSMLWLYVCIFILFLGGVVNQFFCRRRARKDS